MSTWENRRHFATPTLVSRETTSEKWAQKFHTDDVSLPRVSLLRSGWLIGRTASTNQKHLIPSPGWWYVISMKFLRSLLRRHFAGKPVAASRNVGCFLRLFQCKHKQFNYLYCATKAAVTTQQRNRSLNLNLKGRCYSCLVLFYNNANYRKSSIKPSPATQISPLLLISSSFLGKKVNKPPRLC